jgi:hypothetical protein
MTDTPKRSNTQAARTKEFNRRRFIWLDQVMTDGKLAASAFKVAYKLGQHFNEAQGGAAWPSIQTISAGTALPKTVVMRAVRGLQERGHLAIEARRQGRGHSNRCESASNLGSDSILMKCEGRLALVSQRNQHRAASPSSISPGPAGF